MIAKFSTRGRVVIPKALRDKHGIRPGIAYEVINRPDGVLIKTVKPSPAQTPIPVTHP
jgi:AbrB family looped-hinge helix DNA binding protein